jgi:hypothetical protein
MNSYYPVSLPTWNIPATITSALPISEPVTGFSQLNFRWRSQKQIRKNRRRAHAAGFKKAFH